MHESNSDGEHESGDLTDVPDDAENDWKSSRWFAYIAVGIVFFVILLAMVGLVGGLIIFLSR